MEEKLKKLSILADKIYSLSFVLKNYCKTNSSNIEEIGNIYFLVEYLHDNIDILNNILINIDSDESSTI